MHVKVQIWAWIDRNMTWCLFLCCSRPFPAGSIIKMNMNYEIKSNHHRKMMNNFQSGAQNDMKSELAQAAASYKNINCTILRRNQLFISSTLIWWPKPIFCSIWRSSITCFRCNNGVEINTNFRKTKSTFSLQMPFAGVQFQLNGKNLQDLFVLCRNLVK